MSQEIIRCRYCVEGGEFQPMLPQPENTFACTKCGHTSSPENPYLHCACSRCREVNRITNRLSRDRAGIEAPIT